MFESLHERVRKDFKVQYWHEKYNNAVRHRRGTWDSIAKRCIQIRENNIPEGQVLANYEEYDGKFYKENMIEKHIKWRVSDLSG